MRERASKRASACVRECLAPSEFRSSRSSFSLSLSLLFYPPAALSLLCSLTDRQTAARPTNTDKEGVTFLTFLHWSWLPSGNRGYWKVTHPRPLISKASGKVTVENNSYCTVVADCDTVSTVSGRASDGWRSTFDSRFHSLTHSTHSLTHSGPAAVRRNGVLAAAFKYTKVTSSVRLKAAAFRRVSRLSAGGVVSDFTKVFCSEGVISQLNVGL